MTDLNTETRNLEALEDAAYDKQSVQQSHDMRGRFAIMTNLEKVAVLFGNLDSQVCNGGFQQWIENGYGNSASLRGLRRALQGTRELNPQVHDALTELLEKADQLIEGYEAHDGRLSDEDHQAFVSATDDLDTPYYALKEEPMAFFQKVLDGYDAQRDPFAVY